MFTMANSFESIPQQSSSPVRTESPLLGAEQMNDFRKEEEKRLARIAREARLKETAHTQAEYVSQETREEVIKHLAYGEIESLSELSGSGNKVEIAKIVDDGFGIVKKQSGEKMTREGIEARTGHMREAAGFYIDDQILHFDLVSPTFVREIGGEDASIQQFVPNARSFLQLTLEEHQQLEKIEKFKLWIFDYIIWNADRHHNNFVVEGSQLRAIDNGLSLDDRSITVVAKEYFDVPVPDEIKTLLKNTEDYLAMQDENNISYSEIAIKNLAQFIGEEQAKKCIERIVRIASTVREKGFVAKDFDGGAWSGSRFDRFKKKTIKR
jgi:hypothetical protein